MQTRTIPQIRRLFCLSVLVLGTGPLTHAQQNLIPVKVELITRAVSKTPVLIAYDKGLYKKYGLDVQLWMPPGEFPGAMETGGARMQNPEFSVDGGVPMITAILANRGPKRLFIATTDCEVRFNIVGQKTIKSLEELKGKRLGISSDDAMAGFISRVFAQRMGWQRGRDITIVEQAQRLQDLADGKADAFIADDRYMALAKQAGYPVLADTSAWKQPIAGNSVRVEWEWIKNPRNRDLAMRFLKGTLEGLATYHRNRAEAVRVLGKYHGIKDPRVANAIYEEGLKMARNPVPCVEGINKMFDLYDSPEMRKYKPTDFYDDSFMKELNRSGFVDNLYK